jgi:hypothetical protein
MTTVWRPRVRIPVPDIDGADADENRRDELTKKGTKRKRAPKHRGPCEHGVKYRSNCKVCSACPHGRHRRSQCKECGGSSICEHGRQRYVSARSAVGASICEHGRQRTNCKECGGSSICEHGRRRSKCKECGGCRNLRARSCTLCVQGVRWCRIDMRARSCTLSVQGVPRGETVVLLLNVTTAPRLKPDANIT